jgi:hypothetical protein
MTDEEYYELISTFKANFTPTSTTCGKYSNSSCRGCLFYNHFVDHCGLYVEKLDAVLPEFYEKVLLLNPEKLL